MALRLGHDECHRAKRTEVAVTLLHRALGLGSVVVGTIAVAQAGADAFPGADPALGERLMKEERCACCHADKVGGDGSAIHRPAGDVNTPRSLVAMVERCNTELKLSLFPEEEVSAIAAALDRDHCRSKQGGLKYPCLRIQFSS